MSHGGTARRSLPETHFPMINCMPLDDLERAEDETLVYKSNGSSRRSSLLPFRPLGWESQLGWEMSVMFPYVEYQHSEQYYEMVRHQMRYGLHTCAPAFANPPIDVSGFDDWMKEFASYLEEINLQDIIPNSVGETQRKPTIDELCYIEHIFSKFVDPKCYPPWIDEARQKGLSMTEIIITAFEKIAIREDCLDAMKRLLTYEYDGTFDPRVYINLVKKAIDEWENDGNTLAPKTKAKLLSRGLKGDFRYIHSQLCVGKLEPNIYAVDKEIMVVYQNMMECDDTKVKVIHCCICHKSDHVAKYCDKKVKRVNNKFKSGRILHINKEK